MTAIFLIVVIALVAGFMVTIGSLQSTTSAYSIVGSRAYFAALTGVEWAAHEVLDNPATPMCAGTPATFTVTGGATGNFDLTVTCTRSPVTEGTDSYDVFDIDVLAEFGTSGLEDYFSRTISASITSAP